MNHTDKILIVGGYGHVGRRLAAELARYYPEQVIVAGRDLEKAAALANLLGKGVQPLRLDINDPAEVDASLDEVELVINCIDQPEPTLLRSTVRRGLKYLDITADMDYWRKAMALQDEARMHGGSALLGAGLLPGIANVMARAAVARAGKVESLNTAVLLSLGDSFGPAALDYMLAAASEPFTVMEDGRERTVKNFTDGKPVDFPAPIGGRTVYRFALPDQIFYPHTLNTPAAATRFALDPPWMTALMALLAKVGFLSLLRIKGLRRAVTRLFDWMQQNYRGNETYALHVCAQGNGSSACTSLVGANESTATALGAALMARMLIEGEIDKPGVWLPEQVIEPEPFFKKLKGRGLHVEGIFTPEPV